MLHHELWGDELHSWNIAKGSISYPELISNIRYEGHPPLWYTILWAISKFTHQVEYMQLIHWIIACCVAFVILFLSPFSFVTKALIPFGYFFLYEYVILSRNYAIGLLMIFLLCFILRKDFRGKLFLYYLLLFLLTNVHILGIIMAGSLHLYYLLFTWERRRSWMPVVMQILLGAIVFLPALYIVYPPPEGSLIVDFWLSRFDYRQVVITVQSPLRAFLPMPAWWNFNAWNTQFLFEVQQQVRWLRFVTPLLAIVLTGLLTWVLHKDKKAMILFLANLAVTFVFSAVFFPIVTIRYAGFIFIAFLAAWWLYNEVRKPSRNDQLVIYTLLVAQLLAGIFFVIKDWRYPFSRFDQMGKFLQQVPLNERVGTDYWAMNAASAFTDSGLYCIDMQRTLHYISWDRDYKLMADKPYRYYSGVKHLFSTEGRTSVYMVSSASLPILFKMDPQLRDSFNVQLIKMEEGAIEKGSNLYLYQIKARP